ncbi:MAG: hypothetical protein BRD30_07990 [Bacteroidetes bacterium QH_2_63_10]|nr:MAG: hypothetical protein BRD30_07990 [Bacteroidetes bacterium QH_2_63_10]
MPYVRLLLFGLLGGIFLACGEEAASTSAYEQAVMEARVQRDMRMREKTSVIPPERRDAFRGLDFYEVDPAYRFVVPLQRFSTPDTVMIAESTGGVRPQVRIGQVTIPLPKDTVTLVAFRGQGDDPRGRLWTPFADSTNGHTTYKAGRYVDLSPADGDSVVVDFNRAYNPTCAYNPDFACPLPPPENRIDAPVPAGEKRPTFSGEASS